MPVDIVDVIEEESMENSKAIILLAQYMGIDKATAAHMATGKGIIREGDTI